MKILSCSFSGTAFKVSGLALNRVHTVVARDLDSAAKMLAKIDGLDSRAEVLADIQQTMTEAQLGAENLPAVAA